MWSPERCGSGALCKIFLGAVKIFLGTVVARCRALGCGGVASVAVGKLVRIEFLGSFVQVKKRIGPVA